MAKDSPFAFTATKESLNASVQSMMLASYEASEGKPASAMVKPFLLKNAETVAEITAKELAAAKKNLTPEDTADTIAARVAANVEKSLRATYAAAPTTDPIRLAVDGIPGLQKGMGDSYFTLVSEKLKTELTSNLKAHSTELAALKPAPAPAPVVVVAAEPAPVPAPAVAPAPVVAETPAPAPAVAPAPPPPTQTAVVEPPASLPAAPKEEPGIIAKVAAALNPISPAHAEEPPPPKAPGEPTSLLPPTVPPPSRRRR